MPFVEIKSNLANLKFGNDQPGYGSSGLPYIKFTPPTQTISDNSFNQNSIFFSAKYMNIGSIGGEPFVRGQSQYANFYEAMRTGNDYPIRGGAIDFQIGQQTYTLSSKIDQSRIKAFFEDKQRGTAFIQKQIGLQLTNPKMETGNTLFGIGQGLPFPGLLENTRVYNRGLNTLAQVGVSGTGTHALRHGLVPFAPLQKHYYAIVNAQNVNNDKITNRLLNLNALKMTTGTTPFVNPANVFDMNTVNNLGISLNRNLLFQYLGGPGSAYGIGATTIERVVDTTKITSRNAMTYDQIKQQDVNKFVGTTRTTNIQDFYLKRTQDLGPVVEKYNAQIQSLELRLQNDPNNRRLQNKLTILKNNPPNLTSGKSPIAWTTADTVDSRFYVSAGNYKDKLNSSMPFLFENSTAPWQINKAQTDDMINFVFEAISNDDPNYSLALFFRAFLTAGITDNHSAQLNPFRYMGRGENFYTYQGFDRSMAFSFRMAAGSDQELIPMYNRLNALISQVYPDYSGNNTGIMRAPLVRVTVGNYINRVPGFLESVNVTVDNSYTWETKLDSQLPHVVDVSVTFRPIMDILPRRLGTVVDTLSTSTNTDTSLSTDVKNISANVPELIANNSNIISPKLNSIEYSTIRKATETELDQSQQNRFV